MTRDGRFKKRVRSRMRATGETYVQSLDALRSSHPRAAQQETPVQVANISLSTDDLDANYAFYVEFLQIAVRGRYPKMLALEGNLVIDAAHGNPSTWSAHIMLLADDLDAIKRRATEFGYSCGTFPSGHLSLRDPDGRMVEIMPRADWPSGAHDASKPGGPITFD